MVSKNETAYRGTDKLVFGIVLAVLNFWLFAQTTLNVAPAMREDLGISESLTNLAVGITALFSGIFVVVAGSLADRLGRVKLTCAGLALGILGSLLIALSPSGTALFLMAGRIVQGLSAACIMPATLALMKAYYEGKERQRALSYWSIGSWGGSGLSALFGGFIASTLGWRWIFWFSILVAVVSFLLIRGTPESRVETDQESHFEWTGFAVFIVAMLGINVVIGQGAASGIYKMASSLGAAFGVAISAAIFTALSGVNNNSFAPLSDLFLGRTDNVALRFAADVALLFNVLMVVVAIIAIAVTVPKDDSRATMRRQEKTPS